MATSNENKERQAAELTLLTTMYPTEFDWRSDPPPDLEHPAFPDAVFALNLHPSYTLEFTLPETYPSESRPTVFLSCGGDIPTSTRKEARAALSTIVNSQEPNLECLDLITNAFLELLPTFTSSSTAEPTDPENNESSTATAGTANTGTNDGGKIKQVTIWSHHLLATSKRRAIQSWSRELNLSGFSRPGHPGAVFAEGLESDIDEFVRRLKGLRWQALQVRAEDVVDARMLGADHGEGIVEVESLGEIAETLKAKDEGVAKLFLEGMKISGGASAGGH